MDSVSGEWEVQVHVYHIIVDNYCSNEIVMYYVIVMQFLSPVNFDRGVVRGGARVMWVRLRCRLVTANLGGRFKRVHILENHLLENHVWIFVFENMAEYYVRICVTVVGVCVCLRMRVVVCVCKETPNAGS